MLPSLPFDFILNSHVQSSRLALKINSDLSDFHNLNKQALRSQEKKLVKEIQKTEIYHYMYRLQYHLRKGIVEGLTHKLRDPAL